MGFKPKSKTDILRITHVIFFVLIIVLSSCKTQKLPTKKFYGLKVDQTIEYRGDSLYVEINNFVSCPMRYMITAEDKITNEIINQYFPVTMNAGTDTVFHIPISEENQSPFTKKVHYGDPELDFTIPDLILPFPAGKSYKIIQGNNSSPSHNHDGSRYALDFSLKINDTICAAADGYVVSMIEGYTEGGPLKKWRPYGNQIMIYHPKFNVFTIYVHLVNNGSFVELGDFVKQGEAIGLSGLTGYTTVEHLHFDVYKASKSEKGLLSTPYHFKGEYKSTDFTRNQRVKRVN